MMVFPFRVLKKKCEYWMSAVVVISNISFNRGAIIEITVFKVIGTKMYSGDESGRGDQVWFSLLPCSCSFSFKSCSLSLSVCLRMSRWTLHSLNTQAASTLRFQTAFCLAVRSDWCWPWGEPCCQLFRVNKPQHSQRHADLKANDQDCLCLQSNLYFGSQGLDRLTFI